MEKLYEDKFNKNTSGIDAQMKTDNIDPSKTLFEDTDDGVSIVSNFSKENSPVDDEDIFHMIKTKSGKPEPDISSPPYSRFDQSEKTALVIQCAFTGFFSSIAGAIYYPVLTVIEEQFDIDEELVNITVVVYFVFQGISPTIMGGLADSLGRRPIILLAVLIYFGSCIGLACSQTYAQIIILRCLQAAGISPVIAINSGICGDITTRAERGSYVGYISGFVVIGSAFGALIGAGLSSTWGWRSIFWFLAIGSGICLIISIIVLPETKRTIVGNASITPKSYLNRAPILSWPLLRRQLHLDAPGSAFGALIGAGLSSTWGWRSIFWFLAIGSGICLIISIIVLPETKRTIVGNASITPKSYLNRAPILSWPLLRRQLHLDAPDYETLEEKRELDWFAPLKILRIPEIFILLLVSGLQFSMWSTHQTALSTVLSKDYHLTVANIGLCYLPAGVCTLISVISCGRYLNWSYRRDITKHNIWLKAQREKLLQEYDDNIEKVTEIMENDCYYTFNICRSRLQPAFITLLLSSSGFAAYGWCISVKAPLAAVLVTSGFSSLFSNCILTMSTTLIVDLFPAVSSTATGCLNLFRCILSAVFIASLSRMADTMTYGGVFTFLAALTGISSALLLIPVRNGKNLSHKRKQLDSVRSS